MSNDEKLRQVMADIFEVETADIHDDTSEDSLERWDSIHQMNLVFALEEAFGVQFSDDEVLRLTDVKTIKNILQNKGTGF